ncbi:MAG: DUF456 domain-containing protein [Ignavibacteriae bacterium]|nr:DUF456 domain-containing protein [Ignavibacteriota bacterium]
MESFFFLAAIIGFGLILLGFAGCIIPGLPGPPLAFAALIVLKLADASIFSVSFLVIMALLNIAVYFLDYLLPFVGAKSFKASRKGIIFSVIGMLIGMFFFPPFGMMLGLLFGAIIGELLAGKAKSEAIKIGLVSFAFSLFAIFIKIILTAVMAFYFTKAVIENLA